MHHHAPQGMNLRLDAFVQRPILIQRHHKGTVGGGVAHTDPGGIVVDFVEYPGKQYAAHLVRPGIDQDPVHQLFFVDVARQSPLVHGGIAEFRRVILGNGQLLENAFLHKIHAAQVY